MDVREVQQSARDFLTGVLAEFHRKHPKCLLNGLACECDPGAGSLYVFLCDSEHEAEQLYTDYWPYQYVEQEVTGIAPPSWFKEYDELLKLYFVERAIEYVDIERSLTMILTGVAAALVELERLGTLAMYGFQDSPLLSVVTEDDDDEEVGRHRVNQQRISVRKK